MPDMFANLCEDFTHSNWQMRVSTNCCAARGAERSVQCLTSSGMRYRQVTVWTGVSLSLSHSLRLWLMFVVLSVVLVLVAVTRGQRDLTRDTDGDGLRDHVNDYDDDNDGILDIHDEDDDGDGVVDTLDEDWHGDLWYNTVSSCQCANH